MVDAKCWRCGGYGKLIRDYGAVPCPECKRFTPEPPKEAEHA